MYTYIRFLLLIYPGVRNFMQFINDIILQDSLIAIPY